MRQTVETLQRLFALDRLLLVGLTKRGEPVQRSEAACTSRSQTHPTAAQGPHFCPGASPPSHRVCQRKNRGFGKNFCWGTRQCMSCQFNDVCQKGTVASKSLVDLPTVSIRNRVNGEITAALSSKYTHFPCDNMAWKARIFPVVPVTTSSKFNRFIRSVVPMLSAMYSSLFLQMLCCGLTKVQDLIL